MKQTITIAALIALILISCSNHTQSYKPSKADTSATIVLYAYGQWNQIHIDPVIRVTHDTFKLTAVDSSVERVITSKIWQRDTVYYVPVVDTIKEKGITALDSLGKPKVKLNYHPLPNYFIIHDYNKILK